MADFETQMSEVEVLKSIYNTDEEISVYKNTSGIVCVQFYAFLDLPEQFSVLFFEDRLHKDNGNDQDEDASGRILLVNHLPPIELTAELPPDYPSRSAPNFHLSCSWLSADMLTKLCQRLDEIWKENENLEVLYTWTRFLKVDSLSFLDSEKSLQVNLSSFKEKKSVKIEERVNSDTDTNDVSADVIAGCSKENLNENKQAFGRSHDEEIIARVLNNNINEGKNFDFELKPEGDVASEVIASTSQLEKTGSEWKQEICATDTRRSGDDNDNISKSGKVFHDRLFYNKRYGRPLKNNRWKEHTQEHPRESDSVRGRGQRERGSSSSLKRQNVINSQLHHDNKSARDYKRDVSDSNNNCDDQDNDPPRNKRNHWNNWRKNKSRSWQQYRHNRDLLKQGEKSKLRGDNYFDMVDRNLSEEALKLPDELVKNLVLTDVTSSMTTLCASQSDNGDVQILKDSVDDLKILSDKIDCYNLITTYPPSDSKVKTTAVTENVALSFAENNADEKVTMSSKNSSDCSNNKCDKSGINELLLVNNNDKRISNCTSQYYLDTFIKYLEEYNEDKMMSEFRKTYFDCSICYETKMGLYSIQFHPCGHVFCKDCVGKFIQGKINDGTVYVIKCPESKCTSDITPSQVRDVVGPEQFAKYDNLLLTNTLQTMTDITLCPRSACQYPVSWEPDEKMATCPSCNYAFCIFCRMVYHGVEACRFRNDEKALLVKRYTDGSVEEKQAMERRYGKKQLVSLVQSSLSESWIVNNSQNCPHCGANIEKNGGCNKMVCWRCSTYFCWICQVQLDPNSPYVHYNDRKSRCYRQLFQGADISDDEEDNQDIDQANFLLFDDFEEENEFVVFQ